MIKKLQENFEGTGEVKGFEFHQIKRGNKTFIYEVYASGSSHFEVFLIKTTSLCLDFKKRLYSETEFKEIYAKGKDFGKWAWTYIKLTDALNKFYEIERHDS